jgi:CheY-like chemotaxis protein
MTRVLHVDDEPDIREVVTIALGLDPDFTVQSCASGGDAVMAAAEWLPDVILLDVMMPGMDGPATLSRLRESTETAGIPVVFMTARAQAHELQHFVSLGAEGVISKPFDPMELATSVRQHMQFSPAKFAERRENFIRRAKIDAQALADERADLADPAQATSALRAIQAIAHALAAGAGIVGVTEVGNAAQAVERSADATLRNENSRAAVEDTLDVLGAAIGRL